MWRLIVWLCLAAAPALAGDPFQYEQSADCKALYASHAARPAHKVFTATRDLSHCLSVYGEADAGQARSFGITMCAAANRVPCFVIAVDESLLPIDPAVATRLGLSSP